MAIIYPKIEKPKIEVTLPSTNSTEADPLKVNGILAPLCALNGILIQFQNINYLRLSSVGPLPEVMFSFNDPTGLFQSVFQVRTDNYFQVQILPPFDAYEKINLVFQISEITTGGVVTGTGTYKCHNLTDTRMLSIGDKTTWEYFQLLQQFTNLGLVSETGTDTEDSRPMVLNNQSLLSYTDEVIDTAEASEQKVLDWWVDWWDYINVENLIQLMNPQKGVQKIVIGQEKEPGDADPLSTFCLFTNLPSHENTELYMTGFAFEQTPGLHRSSGTSKMRTVYDLRTGRYIDHYLIDGDSKDQTIDYEYGGEVDGYDFVFAKECRQLYKSKLFSEVLHVYTRRPLLGFLRGQRCKVLWVDNSGSMGSTVRGDELLTNIDEEMREALSVSGGSNDLVPNMQVSGQWTCTGIEITYLNGQWSVDYSMVREAKEKPTMDIDGEDQLSPTLKETDTAEVEKSFAVADVFGSIKSNWLTKAGEVRDIIDNTTDIIHNSPFGDTNSTRNELENLYAETKKGIGG